MYDVVIIGGGPAGYKAASLCGKNNLKTLLIEKNKIGGVCLNEGCIPTKALINISEKISAIKNNKIPGVTATIENINTEEISAKLQKVSSDVVKGIDLLLKNTNVNVINGEAKLISENEILVNGEKISGKNIILATGSENKDFNDIIKNYGNTGKVITSKQALELDNIPESIAILGAGAIGIEFAYIYSNLGSKVHIIEYMDQLLPSMDSEAAKTVERCFKKQGVKVNCNSKVTQVEVFTDKVSVIFEKKEKESVVEANKLLIAIGREPNTHDIGLENIDLDIDARGFIKTSNTMQTNKPNIYAIGDIVSGSPMLAHTAYKEAEIAVNHIITRNDNIEPMDNNKVPFCIYSYPQVASFGSSKHLNEENKQELKVFFKSSGKAAAVDKTDGFIKIIADNKNMIHESVIVGTDASEIIHELLTISTLNIPFTDIKKVIHAHPTISESIIDTIKGS